MVAPHTYTTIFFGTLCRFFFEPDLGIFRVDFESYKAYIHVIQVVKSLNCLHSQCDASYENKGEDALMEVKIRMKKTKMLSISLLHFQYSE